MAELKPLSVGGEESRIGPELIRVSTPNSSVRQVFRLALQSSSRFVGLLAHGRMRLRKDLVGRSYTVDGTYRVFTYEIFRDTRSDDGTLATPAVLVVGFRLRWIGSSELLHWAFQRICILTTPIWSGFVGFQVKLWMVDKRSKDYLGIYEWAGASKARDYVLWLSNILVPLSTKGSVWYEIIPQQDLSAYLAGRGER